MSLKTKNQLRAARAMLGWSQTHLAEMAGVSLPTLKRLEPGDGVIRTRLETAHKLQAALERAGIRFTEDGGVVPRIRVRAADEDGIQFEMPIVDQMFEPDDELDLAFQLPSSVIQSVYRDLIWDNIDLKKFFDSNLDDIKIAARNAYDRGPMKKEGKYIEITGEDFDLT